MTDQPAPTIRTVSSYRPQHDFGCKTFVCAVCHSSEGFHLEILSALDSPHKFKPCDCTCGLSALLAQEVTPPPSAQEKDDQGAGLIHQTIPDMEGSKPRPDDEDDMQFAFRMMREFLDCLDVEIEKAQTESPFARDVALGVTQGVRVYVQQMAIIAAEKKPVAPPPSGEIAAKAWLAHCIVEAARGYTTERKAEYFAQADSAVDALIAAIRSSVQPQGWQPMAELPEGWDTANAIIGFDPEYSQPVVPMSWDDDEEDEGGQCWRAADAAFDRLNPTHFYAFDGRRMPRAPIAVQPQSDETQKDEADE